MGLALSEPRCVLSSSTRRCYRLVVVVIVPLLLSCASQLKFVTRSTNLTLRTELDSARRDATRRDTMRHDACNKFLCRNWQCDQQDTHTHTHVLAELSELYNQQCDTYPPHRKERETRGAVNGYLSLPLLPPHTHRHTLTHTAVGFVQGVVGSGRFRLIAISCET